MSRIITITQLEAAINHLREMEPPVDYVLSPDLRAMADMYARMIYSHAEAIDLEQQPDAVRQVVIKWLSSGSEVTDASACAYRAGDPGSDCEACQ